MIECRSLYKSYKKEPVLQDFNLFVEKGGKVLIKGGSGAGKSTLFRIILGIELADKGSVLFNGNELSPDTICNVRRLCAYLDQDVSLPQLSVRGWFEFLFSFSVNHHLGDKMGDIKNWFDFFGLPLSIMDKDIMDLSGGQRQRIGIVSLLSLNRDVFILDEPTAFLDKRLKEKTAGLFLSKKDWTVLVISHDEVWHSGITNAVEIGVVNDSRDR